MTFTIDADTDALARSLAGAADQLRDPSGLLARAGDEVARLAAPRTPRRTGRLAGSVAVAADLEEAAVRWGVGYARHVNFGTRTMRAQPFATDALDAAAPAIAAATEAWLATITEEV